MSADMLTTLGMGRPLLPSFAQCATQAGEKMSTQWDSQAGARSGSQTTHVHFADR